MCGGKCGVSFLVNFLKYTYLLTLLTVKEFWKSADCCQRYEQIYSGAVFLSKQQQNNAKRSGNKYLEQMIADWMRSDSVILYGTRHSAILSRDS